MLGLVDTLREQVLVNQHLVPIFKREFYDKHLAMPAADSLIGWLASSQIEHVQIVLIKKERKKSFSSILILILNNNSPSVLRFELIVNFFKRKNKTFNNQSHVLYVRHA